MKKNNSRKRGVSDMNNEEEIKDKLLKLFEEIDRQSDEEELYIQELLKVVLGREEKEWEK